MVFIPDLVVAVFDNKDVSLRIRLYLLKLSAREDSGLAVRLFGNTRSCSLENRQDKLIKTRPKEYNNIFSQPEILIAIAPKEKRYMDATIILEMRLMIYFVSKGS